MSELLELRNPTGATVPPSRRAVVLIHFTGKIRQDPGAMHRYPGVMPPSLRLRTESSKGSRDDRDPTDPPAGYRLAGQLSSRQPVFEPSKPPTYLRRARVYQPPGYLRIAKV